MATATKTKPQTETLEHVQIEAQSGRFVPPPADMLPSELQAAREHVMITRAAWLSALNRKRVADRVARDAKVVHRLAQNQAALDGKDVMSVVDERPAKYAAQAAATEAAKVALAAAETRWRQLVDGITQHRDDILAGINPDVESAQAALMELERQAAAQRTVTQRLVTQRVWLASIGRSSTGRTTTDNGSAFA